ncbi:MAG: iron uptake porin, partial [Nostoc sp.]
NLQGQVNSVSQLSDIKPSDWAFQALRSLVERYGCIAGYPDGTYRGNRALSRYEFAAGLNACLNRVNELIAAGTSDLVKKEDLAVLQNLQTE